MSRKNIFTGKAIDERHEAAPEPIARLLARAQANNPLPHLSGPRGLGGLGAGRRSGRLTRGLRRREGAWTGRWFGAGLG
jgi:hypothetical protein